MLVSIGTWSVVVVYSLSFFLVLVGSMLKTQPSRTQDDMPAEYRGRAAACTDGRRTAPQANDHKAKGGFRVAAVMIPLNNGIFATRNTHIYVYNNAFLFRKYPATITHFLNSTVKMVS
jgi:hypothetical protein